MKRKQLLMILFMVAAVCFGTLATQQQVHAKTYSSTKWVKKEIKKVSKKMKKAKAEYNAAKKNKKRLQKKYDADMKGTIGIFSGYISSRNPFVVSGSYMNSNRYCISNPNSGSVFLGRFLGTIRKTGGTTTVDGMSCINAKVVSSPFYKSLKKATKTVTSKKSKYDDLDIKLDDLKASLKFNPTAKNKSVYVGKSINIRPSYTEHNAMKWTSSNSSIATVTNGIVYGKKTGTVIITAKTSISKKTIRYSITVREKSVVKDEDDNYSETPQPSSTPEPSSTPAPIHVMSKDDDVSVSRIETSYLRDTNKDTKSYAILLQSEKSISDHDYGSYDCSISEITGYDASIVSVDYYSNRFDVTVIGCGTTTITIITKTGAKTTLEYQVSGVSITNPGGGELSADTWEKMWVVLPHSIDECTEEERISYFDVKLFNYGGWSNDMVITSANPERIEILDFENGRQMFKVNEAGSSRITIETEFMEFSFTLAVDWM